MYTETTAGFAGGRRIFLVDDENKQLDIETSRKVLSRALVRTVDAITALGIRVLLIGQPPEFFQDPNVCFVERSISRRDVSDCLRQPRQLVDQRLRASKEILRKVASGRSATTYVSLDSILCDDQVCRTGRTGNPCTKTAIISICRVLASSVERWRKCQASNPYSCREKPALSPQLIIWATELIGSW